MFSYHAGQIIFIYYLVPSYNVLVSSWSLNGMNQFCPAVGSVSYSQQTEKSFQPLTAIIPFARENGRRAGIVFNLAGNASLFHFVWINIDRANPA